MSFIYLESGGFWSINCPNFTMFLSGILNQPFEEIGPNDVHFLSKVLRYCIFSVIWTHVLIVLWSSFRQSQAIREQIDIPSEIQRSEYTTEDLQISKHYSEICLNKHTKKTLIIAVISTIILWTHAIANVWKTCVYITSRILLGYFVLSDEETGGVLRPLLHGVFFTLIVTFVNRMLKYFSAEDEYEIEKFFGFTRTSKLHWVKSYLKQAAIRMIINPIYSLVAITSFHEMYQLVWNENWTAVGIALVLYFILFPILVVAIVISRLSNVKPLPEGNLKTQIEALADRVQFPKESILVLHSHKASSHPNAFNIKFFWYQRLILFEALIQKPSSEGQQDKQSGLTNDQLESVVAHELGHFKLNHGVWGAIFLQFKILLSAFLSIWLIHQPLLYKVFGFASSKSPIQELLLPGFLIVDIFVLKYIIGVSIMSRAGLTEFVYAIYQRYSEVQADEFAVKLGYGDRLASALTKIAVDNLMFLNDNKLFTALNCTHPSLLERIRRIQASTRKTE